MKVLVPFVKEINNMCRKEKKSILLSISISLVKGFNKYINKLLLIEETALLKIDIKKVGHK